MKKTTTIRTDEKVHESLQQEADSLNLSLSEYLRRIINARDNPETYADPNTLNTTGSRVARRVTANERAIARLQDTSVGARSAEPRPATSEPESRRESEPESERDAGGDLGDADDASPPGGEATGGAGDRDAQVQEIVDEYRERWELWNDDEKAQERVAAVQAVLDALRDGDIITKSRALDRFGEQYSVTGQGDETWWMETVRPVLSDVSDTDAVDFQRGRGVYRWRDEGS